MKTYTEALRYLDSLELFGSKLGLRNIQALVKELGNPQQSYRIVHIAGTNGKGSVAAMCASVLKEAGIRAGLYTSPHLQSFRERIVVDGKMISQKELVAAATAVKSAADKLKKNGILVTHFEVATAMAFVHFRQQRAKAAVLEVGLGGRLDATNVADAEIAVITNIQKEHTEILGNTVAEIAAEKAGIVKKKSIVVTGERKQAALQVFRRICREKKAMLVTATAKKLQTKLLGKHQQQNVSIAATAMERFGISKAIIRRGVAKAQWPGRLEWIRKNVLLDCAHNAAGMKAAVEYIRTLQRKRTIAVVGISDDKDRGRMLQLLAPQANIFIATEASFKPTPAEELAAEIAKLKKNVTVIKNVAAATKKALKLQRKGDLVLVIGSIFVVGEARQVLQPMLR